jgi:hypothetical protein
MFGGNYFGQPYFGQGYGDTGISIFRVFRGITAAIKGFARITRRLA